ETTISPLGMDCTAGGGPTGNGGGQLAYILRARRINVYSDAVELVWLDGVEPANPLFGLYALFNTWAGQANPTLQGQSIPKGLIQDLLGALCNRPIPKVGPGANMYTKNLSGPRYETRQVVTV